MKKYKNLYVPNKLNIQSGLTSDFLMDKRITCEMITDVDNSPYDLRCENIICWNCIFHQTNLNERFEYFKQNHLMIDNKDIQKFQNLAKRIGLK